MEELLKKVNFPAKKSSWRCSFGFHKYVDVKATYIDDRVGSKLHITYQVCERCWDCPTLER